MKSLLGDQPNPEPPSAAEIGRARHELEVADQYQRKTWELLDELNAKLTRDGRLSDRDYERFLRLQDHEREGHERLTSAKRAIIAMVSGQPMAATD